MQYLHALPADSAERATTLAYLNRLKAFRNPNDARLRSSTFNGSTASAIWSGILLP